MNEDFLSQYRKSPSSDFAKALYERISQEEGDQMNTQLHMMTPTHINGKYTVIDDSNRHLHNQRLSVPSLQDAPLIRIAISMVVITFVCVLVFANLPQPKSAEIIITPIQQQQINPPITSQNVAQLAMIDQFGRGIARGVAWSPSGETIALSTSMGVWLYHADDLQTPLFLIDTNGTFIQTLTFSPDGSLLALSDIDGIVIWDIDNNIHIETPFESADRSLSSIAFNSDGTLIASSDYDGIMRIWDVTTGELRSQIEPFLTYTPIFALSFSHDDTLIAFSALNAPLLLLEDPSGEWDNFSDPPMALRPSVRSETSTMNLVFSSDDSRLFARVGTNIVVWDMTTREELATIDTSIETEATANIQGGGGGSKGGGGDLSISPDGLRIATVDDDIRIWDVETGENLSTITLGESAVTGYIHQVAFSPDWTQLVTVDLAGVIRILNPETSEILLEQRNHMVGSILDMAFVPASNTLLFADEQNHIFSLDITNPTANPEVLYDDTLIYYVGQQIAVHPTGNIIAFYDSEANVVLYDLATREVITTLISPTAQGMIYGMGSSIEFSPDGQFISATSYDGSTVRLWNVETYELVHELQSEGVFVSNATFSPDGTMIAYSTNPQPSMVPSQSESVQQPLIEVRDVISGELIVSMEGHTNIIRSLIFVNDATLYSTSDDLTIRRWNLETQSSESVEFTGEQPIFVSMSADQSLIMLTAYSGVETGNFLIDFIDPIDGSIISTLEKPQIVTSLIFNEDNSLLAIGMSSGQIQFWAIPQ